MVKDWYKGKNETNKSCSGIHNLSWHDSLDVNYKWNASNVLYFENTTKSKGISYTVPCMLVVISEKQATQNCC